MERKIWIPISLIALGVFLTMMAACKKGGPATPYDQPRPPVAGDLLIQVFDQQTAVTNVLIQIQEPTGNTIEVSTDVNGQGKLSFKYDLVQRNELLPFNIIFPAQGKYSASNGVLNPNDGNNSFVFSSHDSSLVATANGPVSYPYNLQGTLIYELNYQQPGNLGIPISLITVNGLPQNWSCNFENVKLNKASPSTSVTIITQAYSYKQPSLNFEGWNVCGGSQVVSLPITVRRSFDISIWASSTMTFASSSPGKMSITGAFGFGTANAQNVNWTISYCVDTVANGCGLENYANSFSGSGTGSIGWSRSAEQIGLPIYVSWTASNPDVGTYSGAVSVGVVGNNIAVTHPTKTFN